MPDELQDLEDDPAEMVEHLIQDATNLSDCNQATKDQFNDSLRKMMRKEIHRALMFDSNGNLVLRTYSKIK